MEPTPLRLTERELKEIHHALWYERFANHGTVGHNMLVIIAKFARDKGFWLTDVGSLIVPANVTVLKQDG